VIYEDSKKIGAEQFSIRSGQVKPVTLGKINDPTILLITASP
jgi:hypothetical protein